MLAMIAVLSLICLAGPQAGLSPDGAPSELPQSCKSHAISDQPLKFGYNPFDQEVHSPEGDAPTAVSVDHPEQVR